MNTPPIVSPAGVAGRARGAAGQGEGADPRPRRAGRRAPPDAVDGRGEGLRVRGPGRPGEPARPVRRPPPADRLPLLLRAGRHYPASGGAYPERACAGCSFVADQVAHPAHLNARDTTLAFVSRAPQAEIQGLKERMGWEPSPGTRSPTTSTRTSASTSGTAPTPSSARATGSSAPTSSTPAATSTMGTTWSYLDITALGRQEEWEDSPEGYPQTPPYQWWNYHDAYDDEPRDRPRRQASRSRSSCRRSRRRGAGLLVARAWIMVRVRRRRDRT